MYPNNDKLEILRDDEGYVSIDEMLEMASFEGVAPSICMEKWCDHMTHLEPDGTCECPRCKKGNTVKSCLLLAGII